MKNLTALLALLLVVATSCSDKKKGEEVQEKKAYAMAYVDGSIEPNVEKITASSVSHVYFQVEAQDGKLASVNTENIKKLVALKGQKEDLNVLLSVKIKGTADAISAEGQNSLIDAIGEMVQKEDLDGVEIDCIYNTPAKGKEVDPATKANYTSLLSAMRTKLNTLGGEEKKYVLAAAIGVDQNFMDNTEIGKALENVDYANIKAFDYESRGTVIHHSNLYPSDKYTEPKSSIDETVKSLTVAGVPTEKLVMGISFYGKIYQIKKGSNKGLGDPYTKKDNDISYTELKDKYVNQNEFFRYSDGAANVPYLYNFYKQIFVTYDDEESVKAKCSYVASNNMGGIIIKGLESDTKDYLMKVIDPSFK